MGVKRRAAILIATPTDATSRDGDWWIPPARGTMDGRRELRIRSRSAWERLALARGKVEIR
jgi:hypothetical protein